ncbi:MAG: hypothetical protein JXP34_10640 [Planctomycetes bacterium]|nr:hypothetical protein [Planctomycetota bacterium]
MGRGMPPERVRIRAARRGSAAGVALAVLFAAPPAAAAGEVPRSVSDYDSGEVYWVIGGRKTPYHGMREPWVFNRSMVWLGAEEGVEGAIICCSSESPILLTGSKQVSRWYAGKTGEVSDADESFTRFVQRDPSVAQDHVALPPFQFAIEQTPIADLSVREATHPWRLIVVIKGRSGPPLHCGPWREGPGAETVDLLSLYRAKGYTNHFAEFHFFVFVKTESVETEKAPDDANVVFRLRLLGRASIVPSLPVIRTIERARREGVPIHAVVLDEKGRRLGAERLSVAARIRGKTVGLAEVRAGVWKGIARDLPIGEHEAILLATWRGGGAEPIETTLAIHVTDGIFLGYDSGLRLLTREGKPIGPITGSYRGAQMFRAIGTPEEGLVHGQAAWDAVKGEVHEGQYSNHGGPGYGYHFWESLTAEEFDRDYAYLARCGWNLVHICQGWWYWERLDAGGRIAPHGAEQLAIALAAARRNGLRCLVALSHYPLGHASPPYAQYLEAGYERADYGRPDSRFYAMFRDYLRQFASIFRDETAIAGYTSAGEGDPACGVTFVNAVCGTMGDEAPDQLFLGEPHTNPKPFPRDVNAYRREGWLPVLGGMRTYQIDRLAPEYIGAQLRLAAMGDIFLGEGVFWGFLDGARRTDRYRDRVRREFYTALAYRIPIQLSWEERVVEDERIVFDEVRRAVDWKKPFRRPRLVLRMGSDLDVLSRYERSLSQIPIEYAYVERSECAPAGALFVLDTEGAFTEPAFVSSGGAIPDALAADMPLRIPKGMAANTSWSEDGDVLLAYIHDLGYDAPPQMPAEGFEIVLQNFPAGRRSFRVYDLAAKGLAAEGMFEREARVRVAGAPRHAFLLTGGRR